MVCSIVGGLGNQLFCYAAARRLALTNGASLELDLSFFGADTEYGRSYALEAFALGEHLMSNGWPRMPQQLHRTLWRVRRVARRLGFVPGTSVIVEQDPHVFQPEVLSAQVKRCTILDGYWQDERYFADCANRLRHELRIVRGLDAQSRARVAAIGGSRAIAVHCRRGHYRTLSRDPGIVRALPASYFVAAIERLLDETGARTVLLFGDDPAWLAAELPSSIGALVVGGGEATGSAILDFAMMSACDHFVISNSTFAWWAAWLGSAEGKRVLTPEPGNLDYFVRGAAGWEMLSW